MVIVDVELATDMLPSSIELNYCRCLPARFCNFHVRRSDGYGRSFSEVVAVCLEVDP